MKHVITIGKIGVTVLLLSLIAGCSSLPAPDGESTLLLLDREKAGDYESYYQYWIYIDGEELPYTKFKASDKMFIVEGLSPGKHQIDRITLTSKSQSGEWVLPNSTFRIEMRAGYVTILDRTHYVAMNMEEAVGRNIWYSENPEMRPLTPEAAADLIESFQKKDKDGLWRF